MKVCIYGAGAIGGYLAVALDRAGCQVSLVDRGEQLDAIRQSGLTLYGDDREDVLDLTCHSAAHSLPRQDYVVVAVKSWAVPGIVDDVSGVLGPETVIVSVNNGIPWWYFYQDKGPIGMKHLDSVDPGSCQWQRWRPERALGCVVYPACQSVSPGVIRHVSGNRIAVGEPGGQKSDRVRAFASALMKGGLKAPVKSDIRNEVWVKLIGNLAFNPISVLSGYTLRQICDDPETHRLARAMMLEAQSVGQAYGAKFAIDVDQRIAGAAAVGEHKTSMLQDYESGSPLELDALVAAVQEMARQVDIGTPTIDKVLADVQAKVGLGNRETSAVGMANE